MLNGISNFKQCLKFCCIQYGKFTHSINVNRKFCQATHLFGFPASDIEFYEYHELVSALLLLLLLLFTAIEFSLDGSSPYTSNI